MVRGMQAPPTIFSQITSALHPEEFSRCVQAFPTTRVTRGLSEYDQFLALCFGQLTYRESLRDIVTCLRALIEIIFSSPRLQLVVPFAAELIGTKLQFMHLRPGDFHASPVRAWVEFGLHAKASRRTCVADQIHDGLESS